MEEEIDRILSQSSFDIPLDDIDIENFLSSALVSDDPIPLAQPSTPHPLPVQTSSASRFAQLKTDNDVEQAIASSIPKNTKKSTDWAVNIWKEWSAHRRSVCSSYTDWPVHLFIAQPQELNHWLSKFVLEARKSNGEPYTPDTLYNICSGLLRYIRERRPQINIFKDSSYASFQRTLDGEMKRLRASGLGVKKRQAEPITIEEENTLWEKGVLGESDPQTLLDTVLFLCGIHFALRSGQEHRSLKLSQFELQTDEDGSSFLLYTENTSKNNQGGLSHRKVKSKSVSCYENKSNPQRCLVRIYQVYLKHRPADCDDIFYLTPLKKPKGDTWYSKVPIGHNTLSKTVARLCSDAGILGFKTNHSLQVTSAIRLLHSGADEQLILSHTGCSHLQAGE